MEKVSLSALQNHRKKTFSGLRGNAVKTKEEAIAYVNERGYIFFWPITGIAFPSLWGAVVGDRPVADAHDDPGHVTWGWKDSLLGGQHWYYAKVLRKRSTMISMKIAPYFYALSENYGSPEEDYLTLYEQGRLTQEAKAVYEALLDHGPLDTIALRKAAHLTSQESDSRFNKALADLQVDFKIIPIGVSQAGAWNYAFIYNTVDRQYPELLEQAQAIGEREAYQQLTRIYFQSVGAAQVRDVVKLFGWRVPTVEAAINHLVECNLLNRHLELEGQRGEWIALRELSDEPG